MGLPEVLGKAGESLRVLMIVSKVCFALKHVSLLFGAVAQWPPPAEQAHLLRWIWA
jgi:hypothetical protein